MYFFVQRVVLGKSLQLKWKKLNFLIVVLTRNKQERERAAAEHETNGNERTKEIYAWRKN